MKIIGIISALILGICIGYKVGEEVSVKDFCDDRVLICTRGIHFFMKKEDALGYFAI